MLAYKFKKRGQEMMLLWPVSFPFIIFYDDLWMLE